MKQVRKVSSRNVNTASFPSARQLSHLFINFKQIEHLAFLFKST